MHVEALPKAQGHPWCITASGAALIGKCSARADKAPYRAEGENGLNDGEKPRKCWEEGKGHRY